MSKEYDAEVHGRPSRRCSGVWFLAPLYQDRIIVRELRSKDSCASGYIWAVGSVASPSGDLLWLLVCIKPGEVKVGRCADIMYLVHDVTCTGTEVLTNKQPWNLSWQAAWKNDPTGRQLNGASATLAPQH